MGDSPEYHSHPPLIILYQITHNGRYISERAIEFTYAWARAAVSCSGKWSSIAAVAGELELGRRRRRWESLKFVPKLPTHVEASSPLPEPRSPPLSYFPLDQYRGSSGGDCRRRRRQWRRRRRRRIRRRR